MSDKGNSQTTASPYEARRERLARLLAASLMSLVRDPTGDHLPAECWRQMLPKADAILFIVSKPETAEHRQAGTRLEAAL